MSTRAELTWRPVREHRHLASGSMMLHRARTYQIGRHKDNHIVLSDPAVSRWHAEISSKGDQFEIRDAGSAGGLLVNGARVNETRLAHGAVVHIGPFELTFRALSPEGHLAASAAGQRLRGDAGWDRRPGWRAGSRDARVWLSGATFADQFTEGIWRSAGMPGLDSRRLNAAAWLAIVSAVIAVPMALFMFRLMMQLLAERALWGLFGRSGDPTLFVLLTAANALLFVVLLSTLKSLLNHRFAFRAADPLFNLSIVAYLVMYGLSAFTTLAPSSGTTMMWILGGVTVLAAAVTIVLYIKLLSLPGGVYGMLQPLCYLNIAVNLCLATIVLSPVALLVNMAAMVVLGIVFFRAAEEQAR